MMNKIRRYKIIGSRRPSNYVWTVIIFIGSSSFLANGLASFFQKPWFAHHTDLMQFWPQGLVMSFYGILGLVFSLYLSLSILWSVGGGFNEFNLIDQTVRIFRWGFPGKNRRINLYYKLTEIEGIRLDIQQGLNPKQIIYLQIAGNREIPLTRIGQPITYEQLEKQASDLAKFLNISLKLN